MAKTAIAATAISIQGSASGVLANDVLGIKD
jgi:hypothetical protein